MRTAVDIMAVIFVVGAACLYAFLKLAPRALRRRLAARLGRRAVAVAKSGGCGGCDDCGDAAAKPPDDVHVAVTDITRRR